MKQLDGVSARLAFERWAYEEGRTAGAVEGRRRGFEEGYEAGFAAGVAMRQAAGEGQRGRERRA